uniref:Uncharacterized protein n=1 Tax=Globisporangium ultimum (strain ATCC 200006 / CBS 805.95 / DAOM BR144) TaxID=431595 RepID=K3X5A2_GLOUD
IVKVFIQALGNEAIERHYVLHYAASGGRVRVLEYLTSLAPNLDTEDEDGLTPLGTAVCDFKPRALRCLLVHGADIHAKDHKNKDFSYPHIAAEVNNVKATEILIASGADVRARDDLGGTPLHVAAACGAMDVLKVLLEHGADPYAETHTGFTVVHAAASNSRLSALQYLEERGWTRDFEKEFRGEPQMTPLTLAAGSWEACEAGLVQYLVDFQNRQRMNTSDSDPQLHGPSRTHTATRSEFQREYRSDALLSAAECGHLDVVKYLCDNGAEIDMLARLGTAALMTASMYGHVDVVHYLLTERSARIASRDYDGLTAFHIAVKHGRDDTVKLLIAHGALVDDRTKPVPANEAVPFPELVPIHFAAQSGHFNVLKTLIKHGADLEIENADGLRTIQQVRSTEKGEICGAVGYLLSLGTVDEYSYCE